MRDALEFMGEGGGAGDRASVGAETGRQQAHFTWTTELAPPDLPGTGGMTTPPLYHQFSAHKHPFAICFEIETKFPNFLSLLIHP